MTKDLTVGKPDKVLWKFCLPLFGSIIFQQLYNIADSFVAGKFVGEDALVAVGNSYEITLIFIAFAFGCNIGCSVIVSRLFGAKRLKDMKTAVYTTLISGGVLCLALMIGGLVFSDGLLRLIHTPDNILSDSKLYLDIYIYGDFHSFSSIMWQPAFFPHSAIQKRRSYSLRLHQYQISVQIYCSLPPFTWAFRELRGLPSSVRG